MFPLWPTAASTMSDRVDALYLFLIAVTGAVNSYGWVDPSAQKVRIPIERAIDQMSVSWPNQQTSDEGEGLRQPVSPPPAPNANPAKQTHSGGAHGR